MRFTEVASLPMMRRKLETEVHGSAGAAECVTPYLPPPAAATAHGPPRAGDRGHAVAMAANRELWQ